MGKDFGLSRSWTYSCVVMSDVFYHWTMCPFGSQRKQLPLWVKGGYIFSLATSQWGYVSMKRLIFDPLSPTISFLRNEMVSYTVHFQSHHFISLMLQTVHFQRSRPTTSSVTSKKWNGGTGSVRCIRSGWCNPPVTSLMAQHIWSMWHRRNERVFHLRSLHYTNHSLKCKRSKKWNGGTGATFNEVYGL